MSGQTDFQADINKTLKDAGGYHSIVRSNYGRNIWRVMKELHVLPSDPNFQNLTSEQLDFIVSSIEQDAREMKLAQDNREEDSYVYDDKFDWDGDMDYGGQKDDADAISDFIAKAKKKDEEYQEELENREAKRNEYVRRMQNDNIPNVGNYEDDSDEYETL